MKNYQVNLIAILLLVLPSMVFFYLHKKEVHYNPDKCVIAPKLNKEEVVNMLEKKGVDDSSFFGKVIWSLEFVHNSNRFSEINEDCIWEIHNTREGLFRFYTISLPYAYVSEKEQKVFFDEYDLYSYYFFGIRIFYSERNGWEIGKY